MNWISIMWICAFLYKTLLNNMVTFIFQNSNTFFSLSHFTRNLCQNVTLHVEYQEIIDSRNFHFVSYFLCIFRIYSLIILWKYCFFSTFFNFYKKLIWPTIARQRNPIKGYILTNARKSIFSYNIAFLWFMTVFFICKQIKKARMFMTRTSSNKVRVINKNDMGKHRKIILDIFVIGSRQVVMFTVV